MCVCVRVCGTAKIGGVRKLLYVQTALFTVILGDFRRLCRKGNEVDSDDVMRNMICAVAQLNGPPHPNY